MYVEIIAWDIRKFDVTFAELRRWVDQTAAAQYSTLAGVRLKMWFSDERKGIWGAVYLVDSIEATGPDKIPRLPDGRTGPIGEPPTSVAWFDLEEFVVGVEGLDFPGEAGLTHERRG